MITQTQQPQTADLAGVMYEACADFMLRTEGKSRSDEGTPYIPATVWASQYTTCAREMALRMTKGHELPPFGAETLAKFRRGKDRARNIKADLELAGRDAKPQFELIGQETRFELQDGGLTVISGKVDWMTKFSIPKVRPVPTEYKDWSSNVTDRIDCFEDLFNFWWTKKGAYQLLAYLWATGSESGLMVLGRQGLPKVLPVSLFANESANLKRVEEFLSTARVAVEAKNRGTLPTFTTDAAQCKICDFYGGHCQPPLLSGIGPRVIQDEALERALDRRGEIYEVSHEYDRLDKKIKKDLRETELAVCGKWLIEGSWGKKEYVVVPTEHQALYDSWKKVDPKGKFTLKLTATG